MKSAFSILLLLVLCWHSGASQTDSLRFDLTEDTTGQEDADSLSNIIMNADTIFHYTVESGEVDTLINNVILTQDSLVMYCHHATVFNQTFAKAYEDVVIIHNDTIQIFADSLRYNGLLQTAQLFGEVILQDGDRRLYTTELLYDVNDKTAEYLTGGTLIDGIDTIRSKKGFYYQREKRIKLEGNVSFIDTSKVLRTDSILYLYDIDQLNILAPTEIKQDDVEIYCEGGLYRLESDRGVLSQNVQVQSGSQLITAGILDISGAKDTYTFLVNPKIEDGDKRAKGDTIIFFDQQGILELRSRASFISPTEEMTAPKIIYDKQSESYRTEGRAQVTTDDNIIVADTILSENDDLTRLKGRVNISDKEGEVQIRSDEGLQSKERTKLFSSKGQPILTYSMGSDPLLLMADTLLSILPSQQEEIDSTNTITQDSITEAAIIDTIDLSLPEDSLLTVNMDSLSIEMDTMQIDSFVQAKSSVSVEPTKIENPTNQKLFKAINKVKFMNGQTFGVSQDFVFNQEDSIIVLTNRPVLWSDSTQLTGDTIKIYLQNNEVHQISQLGNAFIVAQDSAGMFNQIKGLRIDNFMEGKKLSRSLVKGNAELFYMVAEGDSYSGLSLTRSDQMTFYFEDDDISNIDMVGKPESNMYEYLEGINLEQYYLDGFVWRIDEKPQEKMFAKK